MDFVEKLRTEAAGYSNATGRMLKEAADEIERLQREGRIGPAWLDGIEWTPDQLALIRRGVLLREALEWMEIERGSLEQF